MSNIRAVGTGLKDRDDDESFQTLVGDVQRLLLELRRGSNLGYGGTPVGGPLSGLNGLNGADGANGADATTTSITTIHSIRGFPIGGNPLITAYASGSGTHSFKAGRLYCFFYVVGGGGQGGGTPPAVDMFGGGGGQGATIFGCIRISGISSLTYSVGAGGSGGVSTGNGGDGTASTLTFGGVTVTASPGLGGLVGGASFTSDLYGLGGNGGGVEFQTSVYHTQWGCHGACGQPGGYSRRGKGGATTGPLGVTDGAGSNGGGQGNAGIAGFAGRIILYEI